MQSKIMQVFYGTDTLPYKDKERTVHYPIIGNTFTGANNTTQIRFYVGLIGNDSAQWVAATQRPKGQAGYELLSTKVYDDEVGEYYYVLDLNSWYTQYKGDIYISLHGYSGGVLIEQDPDTGIYEISGTPTIQTTGAIKIAINYAPQVLPVAEIPLDTLQDILGAISEKVDFQNTIYAAPNITSLNMADYADGQIFYDTSVKKFYFNNNGTLTYIEIDSAIHQYDYNLSTTLQIVYDQVGINKLFYAKLDNRWQLLMLQETSGNYSFAFWDELGYGQTDTIQDLSESIENFNFHYTGSYFPYVEKNNLGGSLTDDEIAILSQPNSVFICFGVIMHKVSSTSFERISASSTSSVMTIRIDYIIIDTSTKSFTLNNLSIPSYTSGGADNLLAQKQNLLINQFNIKSINGQSILGSGNLDVGGGSVAEWGNITGDIADQTDLQNALQENREIAEGKCKSVVLSYAQTLPTNDSQAQAYKKLDRTNFTNLADFNSYVSGLTFRNSIFNSQNDALTYPSSLSYFISSENIVYRGTDFSGIFKTGDIFIITETLDSQGKTLPDRWLEIYVSGFEMLSFHKLETSKVDLTNYATKTELYYQISQVMANFAGLYDETLVYAKGQVVIHDNKLYSCTTAITTPEAWNSTHWTQTTIANEFVNLHGSQVIDGEKTFTKAIALDTGVGSGWSLNNESNYYLGIREKSNIKYIFTNASFVPRANEDLGESSNKWQDLYLARYLSDGAFSYTIAESMAQFNPSVAGTNVIKWSQFCSFSLSADTTLTLETTKTDCLCEYKANITNSGASAIVLTFTGVTNILCNDDNITISTNTLTLPSGVSIEVSIVNNKMVAINFEAQ